MEEDIQNRSLDGDDFEPEQKKKKNYLYKHTRLG